MQPPDSTETRHSGTGALAGLKVVEFAHVIAGPLAGTLLADLGADVVHVDDPGNGDPGRKMGPPKDDVYLWWKVSARNKRSVTLDLRTPEGQEVARALVALGRRRHHELPRRARSRSGASTGTRVHAMNPRAVMLQVTGFGATVDAQQRARLRQGGRGPQRRRLRHRLPRRPAGPHRLLTCRHRAPP